MLTPAGVLLLLGLMVLATGVWWEAKNSIGYWIGVAGIVLILFSAVSCVMELIML